MKITINEEMIRQMSQLQEQGQQADIVLLRKFGERWSSFTRNLSSDFDAVFVCDSCHKAIHRQNKGVERA